MGLGAIRNSPRPAHRPQLSHVPVSSIVDESADVRGSAIGAGDGIRRTFVDALLPIPAVSPDPMTEASENPGSPSSLETRPRKSRFVRGTRVPFGPGGYRESPRGVRIHPISVAIAEVMAGDGRA